MYLYNKLLQPSNKLLNNSFFVFTGLTCPSASIKKLFNLISPGIVICVRLLQFLNAPMPMCLTFGISILNKLLQPANALYPIVVTESIAIELKLSQP